MLGASFQPDSTQADSLRAGIRSIGLKSIVKILKFDESVFSSMQFCSS